MSFNLLCIIYALLFWTSLKNGERVQDKAIGDTHCLSYISPDKKNKAGISGCGSFVVATSNLLLLWTVYRWNMSLYLYELVSDFRPGSDLYELVSDIRHGSNLLDPGLTCMSW